MIIRRLPIILIILLIGCNYPVYNQAQSYEASMSQAEYETSMSQRFNSQVGKANYDSVLSSMGTPISISEGEKIFTAKWVEQFTDRGSGTFILTFDKQTKLLTAWRVTMRLRPNYSNTISGKGFYYHKR